jgi:hypothetical protein
MHYEKKLYNDYVWKLGTKSKSLLSLIWNTYEFVKGHLIATFLYNFFFYYSTMVDAKVYGWENRVKFIVKFMYDIDNNGR